MLIASEISLDSAKLLSLFEQGAAKAAQLGRRIMVSYTKRIAPIEPIDFFGCGRKLTDTAFYWCRPDSDFYQVGLGAVHTLVSEGSERFVQSERGWKQLLEGAVIDNEEDAWGSGPALMGGYSFDPFKSSTDNWKGYPDGALVLPMFQLTRSGHHTFITANALLDANSNPSSEVQNITHFYNRLSLSDGETSASKDPTFEMEEMLPAETWKAIVKNTSDQIKQGTYRKVVLARAARVKSSVEFEIPSVLKKLQASYPTAIIFGIARGGKCFIGATPERLVRLHAGEVKTMALAGSIARGVTEKEDRELGKELLHSTKDLAEHGIVLDMIKEAFHKVCSEVKTPSAPQLLKLRNVQHLYTPVTGRLSENNSILHLIEELHPTPAVGGLPRQAAIEAIRQVEQLDRGWYAAPVGWLDRRGEGEFAVALRSALLKGCEATLFAGCGIMGDSNPDSEYAESNLKMRVMLSALSEA